MIIRLVGSLVDLNSEGDYENYVPFADFIGNLNATPMQHCMDVSVEVDGAMPVPKPLSNSNQRNGYYSKQLSYNREFTITTRRLWNHCEDATALLQKTDDVSLMKKLEYFHTFPYHYFTFWQSLDSYLGPPDYVDPVTELAYVCHHKSEFGLSYYTPVPAFIVASFEAPSVKNNPADKNSKYSAHRVFSWKAREYGIRSLKDIIGG